MTSNKKYDAIIEQNDTLWSAHITRKVTSKKTVITKQQDGFASEKEAQAWIDEALSELSDTQKQHNERHESQRKNLEEIRRQRSNRRAEKTEKAKIEAEAEAEKLANENTEDSND